MSQSVCIVQARMSSGRLSGKALAPLAGRPVLEHVVRRLGAASRIDRIVVAASHDPASDPIEAWVRRFAPAAAKPLEIHRGPEHDCLGRFIGAARQCPAPIYLRATADNPLVDPGMADRCIEALEEWNCDYTSPEPGLAVGLAVECFWARVLEACVQLDTEKFERECVTYPIYSRPEIFSTRRVECPEALRRPYRLTLDADEDMEVLERIFGHFGPDSESMSTAEVMRWLDAQPGLAALNAQVRQRPASEIDW